MFESERGSMSTQLLETDASEVESAARRARLTATVVGPALWRVSDARGRVIGHVRRAPTAEGDRFRAQRFHATSRSFRVLGDFWSSDQAVECLRFSR
jgi:hypothetical protein